MRQADLQIEIVENGFIVSQGNMDNLIPQVWVFEDSESLSEFILSWGGHVISRGIGTSGDTEE